MIVDCDSHIVEPRTCWADRIDPAHRADALAIEDDELGYAWLTWRGRRLYLAEVQAPGRPYDIGEQRLRLEQELPAEHSYDDVLPAEHTDPHARLAALDEWGIDATVLFPNYGLLWEEALAADLPALCANMRAYNRWIAEVTATGAGRLHGVAHLTLRDRGWLAAELARLEHAGIKLAMVAPAPVDGVGLGNLQLDDVWQLFVQHNVAPVFHVGAFKLPLDPAWYADDPEPVDSVIGSVLLYVAPATAVAHLALHGAFARHPGLRVGVVELTAGWVPSFLFTLDGALAFYAARHGRGVAELPMQPSEYVRRQVRVGALAYEQPERLIRAVGPDMFMYGSDWPHAEGIAHPRKDYEAAVPNLDEATREQLMAGNVRWLLGG